MKTIYSVSLFLALISTTLLGSCYQTASVSNDSAKVHIEHTFNPKVDHLINSSRIRKSFDFDVNDNFVKENNFSTTHKPNIYLILFDTLRPDIANNYNNFKTFTDKNYSFKNAYAGGTATIYSVFSLFEALPAFLTYYDFPRRTDKEKYGSIYLKILKKIGYKFNIYGNYWGCKTYINKSYYWNKFFLTFFGENRRLIDRCAPTQRDEDLDNRFDENRDEKTVELLEATLPRLITTDHENFSLISLYNNHNPYRWGSLDSTNFEFTGNLSKKNRRQLYKKSVKASDVNFRRLLNLIETLPGHDDAVIVLLSDHGEMLFEKRNGEGVWEQGHGGIPYQEKIRTLLSFQFGKQSLHGTQNNDDTLASIMDIFPTLFDYIRVTPALPTSLVTGRSLLSGKRHSTIVVQSNNDMPTRNMVLINRSHKAWIRFEGSDNPSESDYNDFYSADSDSFVLNKITDLNDNPLPTNEDPCYGKSVQQCKDALMLEFPEAISELFPSVAVGISKMQVTSRNRMPAQGKNTKLKRRAH